MRGPNTYASVSQMSSSPEQLTILLFERAIKAQIIAIDCLEDGDRTSAMSEIRRCREIFIALAGALDHEVAPELSGNLHRLYLWGVRELIKAGRDGDATLIEPTLEMTEELYEAMKVAFT
jgi:flagellar biosynthetic protein FliS